MLDNLAYLESLYSGYRHNPQSVSAEWRDYFEATGHEKHSAQFSSPFISRNGLNAEADAQFSIKPCAASIEERVRELIRNYRERGHLIASLDPLGATRPCPAELKLEFYNFSEGELDLLVNLPTFHFETPMTLREIFDRLQKIYSHSTGVEFMHIDDMAMRDWLQRRMENSQNHSPLTRDEQLRVLTRLTEATVFEEFLRKKFLGAKTFSLEGCETLLPLLDFAIENAGVHGVHDIIIGMAHRGRLNVLTHIAGKKPCEIFREFASAEPELWRGRGDVKYHLGHSGDLTTVNGQKIHISLCFNPSHLEFINPVALGRSHARQDRAGDRDRRKTLNVLIHGDASFSGEGIIQETLNLSRLAGYSVGGTLHIILNNQIGFTTSPIQGRSTTYATDVAHMLQTPIFHVNGEDPEAVAHVVKLALDFRQEFQSDVFIDMYGYRRFGHNEADEPSFTQPVLYREIGKHKNACKNYCERLEKLNVVTAEEAEKNSSECWEKLEQNLAAAQKGDYEKAIEPRGIWGKYIGGKEPTEEIETGVAPEKISELLRQLATVPENFKLHPKLENGLQARREMAEGKRLLDWAVAEALALATLATEGVRIRLTGQDTARGTFSHRHAIFYDQEDGQLFSPLQNLSSAQASVEIVNSPLSEAGALGFEYGYSLDCPDGLVIWEAQFGDFANVAQVILDQFISSGENKWQRLSGLVLLLPHGYEGMGAEHSSARLERFLALAAEDNIQIAQPTTPAQYFHLLRRQALRNWRKPLVILTPKSLLRHPKVVSPAVEFSRGKFECILPDNSDANAIKRVLLCTGKIFYELVAHREEQKRNDIAILRLEQLYPLHGELLEKALMPFAEKIPVLWVQEEPLNMGAWRFLHEKFGKRLFGRWPLAVIGRAESASPATGSSGAHKLEQQHLIERAFSEPEKDFQKDNDFKKEKVKI